MNKLNKKGQNLLSYKNLANKAKSETEREIIALAINQLVDKGVIDLNTASLLMDKGIKTESFRLHLLSDVNYLKEAGELSYEFDSVRKEFEASLKEKKELSNFDTDYEIDGNSIIVNRTFGFDIHYLQNFFGRTRKETEALLKKNGFLEKFSYLRLSAILSSIYKEMTENYASPQMAFGYSRVYFDEEKKGFSIDFRFFINVNALSSEEEKQKLSEKVVTISAEVLRLFTIKSQYRFYADPEINKKRERKIVSSSKKLPNKNLESAEELSKKMIAEENAATTTIGATTETTTKKEETSSTVDNKENKTDKPKEETLASTTNKNPSDEEITGETADTTDPKDILDLGDGIEIDPNDLDLEIDSIL